MARSELKPGEAGGTLKKGSYPTPAQSMCLGMGQKQTVDCWKFGAFGPQRDGSVTIDPKGYKMWADPADEEGWTNEKWGWKRAKSWKLEQCIWALHSVWDVETGFVLRPDYFRCSSSDEEVEFLSDYWLPHFTAFSKRIRAARPESILFVQPPVFAPAPKSMSEDDLLKGRAAYSAHYYNGLTLITRQWNWFNADALGLLRGNYSSALAAVKIGSAAIRRSLQTQLGILKADAATIGRGNAYSIWMRRDHMGGRIRGSARGIIPSGRRRLMRV